MLFLQITDPAMVTLFAAVLTLVFTLLLNVINATYLEPRRARDLREAEKNALRKAIYYEIASTVQLSFFATRSDKTKELQIKKLKEILSDTVSLDVYRYIREQPTLFYQLYDSPGILMAYRLLQYMKENVLEYEEPEDENERRASRESLIDDIKDKLRRAVLILDREELTYAAMSVILTVNASREGGELADAFLLKLIEMDTSTDDESNEDETETEPNEEPSTWQRVKKFFRRNV